MADASATGSNSALTGLKDVAGILRLAAGSQLTTGSLNIGSFAQLEVDTFNEFNGTGGSLLTIKGTLTNAGSFNLGDEDLTGATNSGGFSSLDQHTHRQLARHAGSFEMTAERAQLTVKTGAAGFGIASHLTGDVDRVEGDASIQFASGEITSIDTGSTLVLFGPQATVADLASPTTNSALTGLANIFGELEIDDGVKISTAAGSLSNSGTLQIDRNSDGGSVLTVKSMALDQPRLRMTIGFDEVSTGPARSRRRRSATAAALTHGGLAGGAGTVTTRSSAVTGDGRRKPVFGVAGHVSGNIGLLPHGPGSSSRRRRA